MSPTVLPTPLLPQGKESGHQCEWRQVAAHDGALHSPKVEGVTQVWPTTELD